AVVGDRDDAFVELEKGIEGLVHISEMSYTEHIKHPTQKVQLGQMVDVKILNIDSEDKKISLGMKQLEADPWEGILDRVSVGQTATGIVRNITSFGAFVEIEPGIDGLVHVSDLSWTHRVKHPSELFKKGDEVEAVVLNIDAENERFSLGIKQLTDDPWDNLPRNYPRGTKVKGKVMKVTDYGAFVEIEPGIDGLVHISELSEDRVNKTEDVLKPGDDVDVMVLDVDAADRRISLSLKAALDGTSDYRAYQYDEPDASRTTMGDAFADKLSGIQISDNKSNDDA
ncbi:MAG: S1 RNA-binding domain-containing protein, partial [Myxococcota bacterium]